MTIEQIKNVCDIGVVVKFKTYNPRDIEIHSGKIVAIALYNSAIQSSKMDIHGYNMDVVTVQPAIGQDPTIFSYIIIDEQGTLKAYAFEWIDVTTFQKIDVEGYQDIRIYNASASELDKIIRLLRDSGYKAILKA